MFSRENMSQYVFKYSDFNNINNKYKLLYGTLALLFLSLHPIIIVKSTIRAVNKKRISYIKVKASVSDVLCKYIICSLAYLLFSSCMPEKRAYTPQKYGGLKGKITSICDSMYNSTWLFNPKELISVSIVEFDAEGNWIKSARHNADSSVVTINEFVYKDNVLFSTKSWQRTGKDIFTVTTEFIGMENGTLRYKGSNSSSQEWITEVKTIGNYQLEYTEGDYGYSKDELWADDDNNIIKKKFLVMYKDEPFANGTHFLEETETIKYDKDGNEIERVSVLDKDTTILVFSYSRYDKYGNWTEQRIEPNDSRERLIKRTINYAGH